MGIYIGDIEVEKVSLGPTAVVKTAVGTIEVPAPTPASTQRWIADNPCDSQLGKTPVDDTGVSTILVSAAIKTLVQTADCSADTVGMTTVIVGANQRTLTVNTPVLLDSVGMNTILCNAYEISLGE